MIRRTSRFVHARHYCLGLLLALGLTSVSAPAAAQGDRFSATATNMSNVGPQGVLGPVDIIINRYSTEDERNRFLAALAERGPDGLLDLFRRSKSIGRLAAPGRLGYEIRYAAKFPGEDGGYRVIVATDRLMSFLEVRNQPRTVDYPFTVVQLNVGPDGTGEGRASVYTRITTDKRNNTIVLEDFGSQPVTLMNVRAGRSPK